MKIVHLSYEYPSPWNSPAPFMYEFAKAQTGISGNEITVIRGGFKKPVLSCKDIKIYGALSISPIFGPFLSTSPWMLLAYLYLKIFKGVDVVVGHNHVPLFFSLYKLIFGKLDKTPYIAYFHSTSKHKKDIWRVNKEKPSFFEKNVENRINFIAEVLALKTADYVFCETWQVLSDLEYSTKIQIAHGKEDEEKHILFAGVDARHYSTNFKAFKQWYFLRNKKVIFYCDYISTYGKAGLLIDVVERLGKDYHLFIVGDIENSYAKELKKKISDMNILDRVTLVENPFYREYITYYQTCDVVVLPAVRKDSHIRIIEGLASGKPVLYYTPKSAGGTEELIENNATKLERHDLDYLERMIKQAVNKKHKIDSASIKSLYSWERRAQKMQEVINYLVKPK